MHEKENKLTRSPFPRWPSSPPPPSRSLSFPNGKWSASARIVSVYIAFPREISFPPFPLPLSPLPASKSGRGLRAPAEGDEGEGGQGGRDVPPHGEAPVAFCALRMKGIGLGGSQRDAPKFCFSLERSPDLNAEASSPRSAYLLLHALYLLLSLPNIEIPYLNSRTPRREREGRRLFRVFNRYTRKEGEEEKELFFFKSSYLLLLLLSFLVIRFSCLLQRASQESGEFFNSRE